MKIICNIIGSFLVMVTVNLFSMYGDREGVVSHQHAKEIAQEEQDRHFQAVRERLERDQRERARREAIEQAQRQGIIQDIRHRKYPGGQ